MSKKRTDQGRSYELALTFVPRVATEHLGSRKYSSPSQAVGELVSNALDAGSSMVSIELRTNGLGAVESLVVSDDGHGMTSDDLRNRFAVVGVEPEGSGGGTRLGRFGVGRLAVHRLGSLSEWQTVAATEAGRTRSRFRLATTEPERFTVTETVEAASTPTGTRIEIFNLVEEEGALTPARLHADLVNQFCSYLLGNRAAKILVQGERLDVGQNIETRDAETLPPVPSIPGAVKVEHLLLRRPMDQTRQRGQILFSANGRTVARVQPDDVPSPNYVAVVECPYLDSIVTSNREAVIEMDAGFTRLRDATLLSVTSFGTRWRANRRRGFVERAREEPYYPYRGPTNDPVTDVRRAIYDVVLERVNEHANIEGMTKRQQAVMFSLLDRSLNNENLLEILHSVARLSDEDIERFRKVLERTTLDSLIRLSSEVTARLEYLDALHALVYGDGAARLKERTQLHRVVEAHCWLFGPRYHLATSDQSFREVIRQHRAKAGLDAPTSESIIATPGVEDIPDLFLAAKRDYPVSPAHCHLLVELKAPNVVLGRKEIEQAKRYADTVLDSQQFDKTNTYWEIFLVSARISESVERDRTQKDKPHGCLWDWDSMRVWAFSWGELISKARDEMRLVREHLSQKSKELSVSEYLRENFPEVLTSIEQDEVARTARAATKSALESTATPLNTLPPT